MSLITKPMLAAKAPDLESLSYPVAVTPKLDGIRALKIGGNLVSRTFKPIKNDYIRTSLESVLPDGIDGELWSGSSFQDTTSAVMAAGGKPEFVFFAFDYVESSLKKPYMDRMNDLEKWWDAAGMPANVSIILPLVIMDAQSIVEYEEEMLALGYEGIMVRDPEGPYKCGRSTANEGYLLKVKRFDDAEAEIVGFEEQLHNMNEAKKDAFGRTERSSHKENKVPAGVLGKFIVKDLETGIEFGIGTGFDASQREQYWADRDSMLGKIVKYKSFKIGVKEAPRHPVFLGFRDASDL